MMPNCEVCGTQAKSAKVLTSKRHLASKKHKDALEHITSSNPENGNELKPTTQVSYTASIKLLERRVEFLEQQNAIVMKKLETLERANSSDAFDSFIQLNQEEMDQIKQILLNRLEYGNPTSIDTLGFIFSDYNWTMVERAIIDLSAEGVIQLEEGDSQLKISNQFAFITRLS